MLGLVLGIGLVLGLAHFTFCHTTSPHFTRNGFNTITTVNLMMAFPHDSNDDRISFINDHKLLT